MYNIYNDDGKFVGFTSIKDFGNATELPIKPLYGNESAYFKNGKWEYGFEEHENFVPRFDSLVKDNKEIINLGSYINSKISPNCGTYIKEKESNISVLIPCYGKADTVSAAVDSCLEQTLLPMEIVVLLMDEESQKLKDRLTTKDYRVRCICGERENPSKARNHLVEECKSEYFIFLDGDDTLEKNFIETMYKEKGSIVISVNNKNEQWYYNVNKYSGCVMINLTFLMCKEVWNELGGLDEELCWGGEDTDFIIRIFKQKKWYIGYTNKTKYIYNIDEGNHLINTQEFIDCHLKLLNKQKGFFINELRDSCIKTKKSLEVADFLEANEELNYDNIHIFMNDKKAFSDADNFYEELEKSRNRDAVSIFNKDDFYIPEEFQDYFYLEDRLFDVIILGDVNPYTVYGKRKYVMRKEIKEIYDRKKLLLSDYELLMWLVTNYSCFLYKNFATNLNISSKEDLEDKDRPIIRQVSISLNKTCNAKCEYCTQAYFDWKEYSDDEIYDRFDKIVSHIEKITNKNCIFSVLGGEPSIWSDYLIKKVINRLSGYNKFCLDTNGLIRNPLWENCPNIYFYQHILNWENMGHFEREFNRQYMIVVTHKNVSKLRDFVAANPDHQICLDGYIGEDENSLLTDEDINTIEQIERDYPDVDTKLLSRDKCIEKYGVDVLHEACATRENMWRADCTEMTIHPCCGRYQSGYKYDEFTGQNAHLDECGGCMIFNRFMKI